MTTALIILAAVILFFSALYLSDVISDAFGEYMRRRKYRAWRDNHNDRSEP